MHEALAEAQQRASGSNVVTKGHGRLDWKLMQRCQAFKASFGSDEGHLMRFFLVASYLFHAVSTHARELAQHTSGAPDEDEKINNNIQSSQRRSSRYRARYCCDVNNLQAQQAVYSPPRLDIRWM
jgi:hypothetical protein